VCESAVQCIEVYDRGDDAQQLDVVAIGQTGGDGLLVPRLRQPARVGGDAVCGVDRGSGQRADVRVLALHRVRRQGCLALAAEAAVARRPHFGSDGNALASRPPVARRGQTFPGAAMRGAQRIGDRQLEAGVTERLHEAVNFRREHRCCQLAGRSGGPGAG
jgi:hypothetical protein